MHHAGAVTGFRQRRVAVREEIGPHESFSHNGASPGTLPFRRKKAREGRMEPGF
jgi:hypothetical protein